MRLPRIFRHIRTRLIVIYFVLSTLTLGLIGLSFYYVLRDAMDREMGSRLVMVAQTVTALLDAGSVESIRPGDEQSYSYKQITETMRSILKIGDAKRIYAIDRDHKSLADTQSVPIGTHYFRMASSGAEIKRAFEGAAVDSMIFQGLDGRFYKSAYAPLVRGREIVAVIGVDADVNFFETLKRFRRDFFFYGVVAIILIVIASLALAVGFERPIARLVLSAQRMAEGDLETKIEPTTRDEIGFLAQALDKARQSIVERDKNLKVLQRGIAHEVRNPLGGMRLFCDILADEVSDDEAKLGHVEKIKKELFGLENVVNEFLDYTRDLPFSVSVIDVHAFLMEIMGGYSDLVDRGVNIHIDISPHATQAQFDPSLIRRALFNIINNAIQAMPNGGDLRVMIARTSRTFSIEVSDTGIGIKQEDKENLFTPFFTTKDKGTGLGMPFAMKAAERHEGTITVASTPNKGTTVKIHLPIT